MKNQIIEQITAAVKKLGAETQVELTPAKGHGDFSTNVAMKLARQLGDSPQNIATKIVAELKSDIIEKAEVAGPGFINIFLKGDVQASTLQDILDKGDDFGKGTQSKYINIEYVSANPTGYLHLGHARGAAVGATLAAIQKFAGNKVDEEYYVNDAGNQIEVLGLSSWTRYQQQFGSKVELPEDSYRGQDIVEQVKFFTEKHGEEFKDVPYEECKEVFKTEMKKLMLDKIAEHLGEFGIKFDMYSSEQKIYDDNLIKPALEALKDHIFEKDGATWLDTTSQGDDKDRVLIKSDGLYTYLTPDIAYHKVKLDRGYDEIVNIWGADHSGYIKRMEVALGYLGLPKEKLDVLVIQLVRLIKDGKELKMSKRMGTSFTLHELMEIAGKDATRFYMINRATTSKQDFDVDEATKQSSENPVFTIKYTHARASKLLRDAPKYAIGTYKGKEIELINILSKFPELIDAIATNHKVHLMPQYLIDVARTFNSFYSNTKIIGTDRQEELMALVKATKIILKNGMKLIGVSAPVSMKDKGIVFMSKVLDYSAIKIAGLETPIDVNLTHDEQITRVSWHNLSDKQIEIVRHFIADIPNDNESIEKWRNSINLLDEKKFNTRNGFSKEGNTGHANSSILLKTLSTQEVFKEYARDVSISDKKFAAFFFEELYRVPDIGVDTVSDFVTLIMIEHLKDYTKSIYDTQSDLFHKEYKIHEINSTINMYNFNILLLPKSLESEEGIKSYDKRSPIEIQRIYTKYQFKIYEIEKWEFAKNTKSALSKLKSIFKAIEKQIEKNVPFDKIKASFKGDVSKEVVSKIDVNEIINVIFENHKPPVKKDEKF